MADATRKQIVDAFVTALTTGTTEIATISTRRENWWDWDIQKFPGVCILEGPENKSRFSYLTGSTSDGDMYAELEINILGYVMDLTNNLEPKRTDLVKFIEQGIQSSTALNDLTLDVVPQEVLTDQGTLDNQGIVHCRYMVKYLYNHASP